MRNRISRRNFINQSVKAGAIGLLAPNSIFAQMVSEPIKIGIVGLDTSHAPAFTKLFNTASPESNLNGIKVVAAYPNGSTEIKSSYERIPEYILRVKEYGVEVVDSIQKLLSMVDVVLLETNDGRPHLEQAREIFKTGKPVFIDKPMAGTLKDVVTIFKESSEKKVPVFSSSSLRYMKGINEIRYENKIGSVLGSDTFSPATLEPHHPDLFWYGIHGVEILFAVMGTGCESVTRIQTTGTDVVVGKWKDGRIGTFRGNRNTNHEYGGTVYGSLENFTLGPYEGYEELVIKIAEFFKTKISPVDPKETLEIYAFMEAADESKRNIGASVRIDDVLKKAGYN